ncbi:MAG TPA: SBBP repeat-containing protein, partial [Terriglobales bacterium]|nr:SBBP repeat-containing protein [Terriglobales bacterium]
VTYPSLWEGVTLIYDAPSGAVVRSTYRLDAHANVGNIRLRYNAPVAVQSDGSLRVSFQTSTLNESAPQAWQERDGKRVPVRIAFAPRGNAELTFAVGEYNRGEPLFIDPTLTWNTFLGGAGIDEAFGFAVDVVGNFYVVGFSTAAWGSPVAAYDGGGADAFAAKLDSNGNLIWNTFLGGGGAAKGFGVAVDVIGNVYVTGFSNATWGSPVHAFNGGIDIFVVKLDSNGNLIWNTFLGGSGPALETGRAVAVDVTGNVYVAGYSPATWCSPVRAFSGGPLDAFAAKLDSNGILAWSTFLGGGGTDYGYAVAVDISGNVYVAGDSDAAWGSPVRAFSGGIAAFVAKLDPNGTLTWNTFLGGGLDDSCQALAMDESGNVYVAGYSEATWGSPVRAFSGGQYDVFAAKLDSGGALTWNTFLGSGSSDFGAGVTLDASGNVYVGGYSAATWGTPTRGFTGGLDVFAAKLDSGGALTWNTFLGSGSSDFCFAVAVDANGDVGVAGW